MQVARVISEVCTRVHEKRNANSTKNFHSEPKMVAYATNCCCGLTLPVGVRIFSIYDVISGTLGSVVFLSGLGKVWLKFIHICLRPP